MYITILLTFLHFVNYSIDLVTGGPVPPPEPSPLDSMTDEAKEAEAEKLMGLINQLNRYVHAFYWPILASDCLVFLLFI